MLDGGIYLMNSAQQNLLDEIFSIKNLHAPCRRDSSQRGKVSHAGTGPSHLSETLTIELTNKCQPRNYCLRFSYLLLVLPLLLPRTLPSHSSTTADNTETSDKKGSEGD